MASSLEYARELVDDIGPRLAGTDREYHASELIASRFGDFGLTAQIEEFDCYPYAPWVPLIGYALVIFGALFSFFIPGAGIGGLALVVVGSILVLLELLRINPIHLILPTKLSQNVVARYVPAGNISTERLRKVVVLAHYDTGRSLIEAAPVLARSMKLLRILARAAIVVVLIAAILVLVPLPELALVVTRYVMLVAAAIVVVTLLGSLLNHFRPPQRGANCNASGVVVLYRLAEMLTSQGAISSAAMSAGTKRRSRRKSGQVTGSGVVQQTGNYDVNGIEGLAAEDGQTVASAYDVGSVSAGQAGTAGMQTAAGVAGQAGAAGAYSGELAPETAVRSFAEAASAEDTYVPGLSTRTIADNLVQVGTERRSPFVFERAPGSLSRAELAAIELQEQESLDFEQADEANEPTVPAWYTNARKNAEQKIVQRAHREGESEIVRSRFADIPMSIKEIKGPLSPTAVDFAGITAPERETSSEADMNAGAEIDTVTGVGIDANASLEIDSTVAGESPIAVGSPDVGLPRPDLTGIDRQAFQVLNGDEPNQLIIPAQSEQSEQIEPEAQGAFERLSKLPSTAKPTTSLQERLSKRLKTLPEIAPASGTAKSAQQAGIEETTISGDQLFAEEGAVVSNTGSFIPLASTGAMKPVGEELVADISDSDRYVEDADDVMRGSHADYTSEGTYSDPELMQIEESPVRSFFSSLGERLGIGKRKQNIEDAPAEWLGLDEDFDPRKEGSSIGSWESFNDDDETWQGGAYGGESFQADVQAINELSNELLDKEVWLVALGSNGLGHAGVRYFLKRHDRQLKSSLFINLLGVGAGDLCYTILEGEMIARRTDQRLQNLLQSAAQEIATPIAPRAFTAFDTDASVILRKTSRVISLIGMGDALPQNWRFNDDSISRLREDKIAAASEIVLETIKNC